MIMSTTSYYRWGLQWEKWHDTVFLRRIFDWASALNGFRYQKYCYSTWHMHCSHNPSNLPQYQQNPKRVSQQNTNWSHFVICISSLNFKMLNMCIISIFPYPILCLCLARKSFSWILPHLNKSFSGDKLPTMQRFI